jgi:hypothetical protein
MTIPVLVIRELTMVRKTEMVLETSVYSSFNHLTQLLA